VTASGVVRSSVAVVVVAAATALTWVALHRPGTGPPERPRVRFELAVDGGEDRVDIVSGTPLVFEISVTTREQTAAMTIGRAGMPWTSLVRLSEIGPAAGRSPSWKTVPIGKPQSMRLDVAADGRPDLVPEWSDEIVIDRRHFHRMRLAIAPETTATLAPGMYEVRAALESGGVTLVSAPVAVTVIAPTDDASRDQLSRNRLAATASYYLQTQRVDDARRAAEELCRVTPQSALAWMMLGDAFAAGERPRDALGAYRRALDLRPRTYEEPTELYDRMAAVAFKLGPSP